MIEIPQIVGEFTNADQEDIPQDHAVLLQNLLPRNGKLIKTHGFGSYLAATLGAVPLWIGAYTHRNLSAALGSGAGYALLAYFVDSTTKVVTIKYYNGTTLAWTDIDSLLVGDLDTYGAFYHKADKNPVIQANNILRFLPGNIGTGPVGSELITAPMVTGGWTLGTDGTGGWSITAGVLSKTTSAGTQVALAVTGMTSAPVIGKLYRVTIVCSAVSGTVTYSIGGKTGTITAASTVLVDVVAESIIKISFSGPAATTCTITSVSVKNIPEAKGIWIGYIEGDYFDGVYTGGTAALVSAGTKVYEQGFYAYPTEIVKPHAGGGFATCNYELYSAAVLDGGYYVLDDIRWYKISLIYDGIQESLLSDAVKLVFTAGQSAQLRIDVHTTSPNTLNKRVTAINIYRASYDIGPYNKIMSIDLKRKAGETYSGTTGAYSGHLYVYIPTLSTFTFTDNFYWLVIGSAPLAEARVIDIGGAPLSGTGIELFKSVADPSVWDAEDIYNQQWILYGHHDNVFLDAVAAGAVASGTSGAFCGMKMVIVTNADADVIYSGGVVLVNGTTYYSIKEANRRALHVHSNATITEVVDVAWLIMTPTKGLYHLSDSGVPTLTYQVFDNKITAGAEHPYPDAVSLKINAQHATIMENRLHLADLVLDPGNTNEVHEDWHGYSEVDSFDVCNVSNVKNLPDREGGSITGMVNSFGLLVFSKKHGYFRRDVSDPDPANWTTQESKYDKGNISNGLFQVGDDFYPIAHDGFYKINPNILAASDVTPMIKNRISEAINDQILSLTEAEKILIFAGYEQLNNEIFFRMSETLIKVFNVTEGKWRTITTSCDLRVFGLDHEANLIAYDFHTDTLRSTTVKENVIEKVKTKRFRLSMKRKEILRAVRLVYNSEGILDVNTYTDDAWSTAVEAGELAVTTDITDARMPIKRRCKAFMLEIAGKTSNDDTVEIHKIVINPPEN